VKQHLLIVEDDASLARILKDNFTSDGFDVECVTHGSAAIAKATEFVPDLIILDVNLPGTSGFDLCGVLRGRRRTPIVILTARSDKRDKLRGLSLGADDYITKPFSMREFRSRVKAVLRRADLRSNGDRSEEPLEDREVRIDFGKRQVEVRGEPVKLTYVEFEILAILARSPGRVFSRTMLLERLWGDAAYRDPRTIDVHIRHLREKIERDAKEPELIFTVRGVGYHFRDR
jgi:DNA-binding response OmpR family regulator